MKKTITYLAMLCFSTSFSQTPTPKLYIGITSHNEMKNTNPDAEPYDNPDGIFFNLTKDTLKKIADLILAKGAKYNLQTCQRFVYATHQHQAAGTSTLDILEYCYKLGGVPGNVIEIDPRSKTDIGHNLNMADVAHMIDSTGASSSKTVGGFIYKPSTSTNWTGSDWTPYTTTITGIYNKPWKANIIWGAGSSILPLHTQDANNYGVWKPRGTLDSTDFYCHSPSQNVWVQGNGCAWNLEPTTNLNSIIADIRVQATKIVNGTFPANKFYGATVMINFKHFQTAGLRQRLSELIDSINVMVSQGKIVWSTITQKQAAFQAWSTASGIPYSQWRCSQTTTLVPTCAVSALEENGKFFNLNINLYPNPAQNNFTIKKYNSSDYYLKISDVAGKQVMESILRENETEINVQSLTNGIYFLKVNDKEGNSAYKKIIINK